MIYIIHIYFGHSSEKMADRVGFEPTVPFGTSDFKSDAIDQLCHLSVKRNEKDLNLRRFLGLGALAKLCLKPLSHRSKSGGGEGS
jgi:hypothetical protein